MLFKYETHFLNKYFKANSYPDNVFFEIPKFSKSELIMKNKITPAYKDEPWNASFSIRKQFHEMLSPLFPEIKFNFIFTYNHIIGTCLP